MEKHIYSETRIKTLFGYVLYFCFPHQCLLGQLNYSDLLKGKRPVLVFSVLDPPWPITAQDNREGVSWLWLAGIDYQLSFLFILPWKTTWWRRGVRTHCMSTEGNIHINTRKTYNEQSSIGLININEFTGIFSVSMYHSHDSLDNFYI